MLKVCANYLKHLHGSKNKVNNLNTPKFTIHGETVAPSN